MLELMNKRGLAEDVLGEWLTDLSVPAGSIDKDEISANIAGDGLSGGAGSALSVSVDDSTIETSGGKIQVKNGGITSAKIGSFITTFEGLLSVGYIDFTGVSSDTETITIDGRVYEIDSDSTITGDVPVDISGGNSATQTATALTGAINGDGSKTVDALDVGDGTVILVQAGPPGVDITLATTCANGVVSAASGQLSTAGGQKIVGRSTYTVTAADVTVTTDTNGKIVVSSAGSEPEAWIVQVRDANGVVTSYANSQFAWEQVNSNFYVLTLKETQAAATDLTATDVITVIGLA